MAANTTTASKGAQQQLDLQPGQSAEILIADGQNISVTSNVDAATKMSDGTLVIRFANDATLTIKNFDSVSGMSSAPTITMSNGQTVSLVSLLPAFDDGTQQSSTVETPTLTDVAPTQSSPVKDAAKTAVIDMPKAGQDLVVTLEEGVNYSFGFAMNEPVSVQDNQGQLVISFKNGGEIIIPNYGALKNSDGAPAITLKDGTSISANDFSNVLATATQLNQIEPAAGDGGAGGRAGGFGFQSSFAATPFIALDPIGPINPTQLVYNVTDRRPEPELTLTAPSTPPSPVLEVQDSFVFEDGSVGLNVFAQPNNGNEQLTITITGFLPGWTVDTSLSGGTYDAATGTWTITLPKGVSFAGGPIVAPPADSDEDMPNLNVSLLVEDTVTGLDATVSDVVNVFTDAVADTPSVTALGGAGAEDTPIALNITTAPTDVDGSEVITNIIISGVPTGATLNNGVDLGGGNWQLTLADLTGLTITPPLNFSGSIPLTVTVTVTEVNLSGTEFDLTNNVATNSAPLVVLVEAVPDAPNLEAFDKQVKEDGSVALEINASLNDTDGSEVLTVSVSGIAPGWGVDTSISGGTYNAATGTWTLTLPAGVTSFSGGPTLSPPANSDVDLNNLLVTATATEQSNGTTASVADNVDVIVDAVIDAPSINAPDVTGNEDSAIPLNITVSRGGDTLDGSEVISAVTISGVPTGAVLSAGTDLGGGNWSVPVGQLPGLTLTPPANYNGSFTLTVSVTDTETNLSGIEFDLSDNTATATDTLVVNVTPQGETPTVSADDVQVKEDGSVQLVINAALDPTGPATDFLTVSISGIDPAWGVDTTISGGTYDSATATWTITLPAGTNFSGGPVFSPPANSDADLTGLVVTAVQTDPLTNQTGTATDTANIFTDAVIDGPDLGVSNASGEEDTAIALNITVGKGGDATDGSEVLSDVTISGVPSGAVLSAGTDLGGGNWLVPVAQLPGLTLTPPVGFSGQFNLTVSVTDTETNLSGVEFDLSDNTATVTKTLKVNVVPDDVPEIINPAARKVDETNLTPGPVTVSGAIVANFFSDAPGVFAATGLSGFSFGGSAKGGALTSNGVAVTVTLEGGNYVGRAGTEQIFTLQVNADGSYVFKLTGVLDHANTSNPDDVINLNFGIKATDSDGDVATTTLTVKVHDDGVTANDDVNTIILNGGPGAADDLSEDTLNTVTKVTFEGTDYVVPAGGSATVNGDYGTLVINSDGSYTYTLLPQYASGVYQTTNEHDFDGSIEFPVLIEGVKYTGTEALGVVASDISVDYATKATMTFVSEGAGFSNSVGSYIIDPATGEIKGVNMLFLNGNATGAGTTAEFDIPVGGGQLGFFVVANGWSLNGSYAGFDFSTGSLSFINVSTGLPAKITDNPADVKLIFTSQSGVETVLSGPVYHTTARGDGPGLNPDGKIHTVSGAPVAGDTDTLRIGFEDLPNLGDTDYEDFIFDLTIAPAVEKVDLPEDIFTYTLTDADGDNDTATLTINTVYPTADVPTISALNKQVKEDGSVALQINAALTDTDGSETLTVEISGIAPGWTVNTAFSGGTYNQITGVWKLTLPAGVTSFSGGPTLSPPANSDIDLNNLVATATATEIGGGTASATATFNIAVDAVIDAPTLTVDQIANQYWHKDYTHTVALKISSKVTDNDGSEVITKIVVKLNSPFTNPAGGFYTLDDMGVGLNKGTEVSPGVWEIPVNNGDASAALNGLALTVPAGGKAWVPLHRSKVGGHSVNIIIESHAQEKNLNGTEYDFSDNDTKTIVAVSLNFYITPLAIDLGGDGFEIISKGETVLFDMTNDGVLDRTSWIGASDGILAIDLNGDSTINNQSELFGNSEEYGDGFENLASYDLNGDGKIDIADDVFNQLLVWQDLNQDGVSQAEELFGLGDLGIASIGVNADASGAAVGDSVIAATSKVTFADGSQTTVADVLFSVEDGTTLDQGATIVGGDGQDTIYGTDNNDSIYGGFGDDVLFGDEGSDTFVVNAAEGVDTIKDFSVEEGDILDISSILSGFDPLTESIHDFVKVVDDGQNTIVQVDTTGTGAAFHTIAVLEGVRVDVDTLANNGNLIA